MADKNDDTASTSDDAQQPAPGSDESQPDADGASEGTAGQEQPGAEAQASGAGEQSGAGAPSTAEADGEHYTEEDLDAEVQRRMEEQKREQERKRMEKQGEYKDAYEDLKAEHEDLKQKAERADTYAEKLNGQIEGEIEDWPDEVKATDPGPGDLDARLSDPRQGTLHAKAIATPSAALVGSTNWGLGGVLLNREVNLLVHDGRVADEVRDLA
jgi:phosphatidylserine/phosphatidylglycerophosphate/cardiolipin synthase-like enzyme